MARYRYRGDTPRSFDALGLVVEPGEEFESEEEINHPDVELVTEPEKGAPEE